MENNICDIKKKTPSEGNLSIPVSFSTSIWNNRKVCVCFKDVICIFHSWWSTAGHWITDRWRPTPPQADETLELIGDLRQETLLTARGPQKQQLSCNYIILFSIFFLLVHNKDTDILWGMQIIPESHLASISKVAPLHDGVFWNDWYWAGAR